MAKVHGSSIVLRRPAVSLSEIQVATVPRRQPDEFNQRTLVYYARRLVIYRLSEPSLRGLARIISVVDSSLLDAKMAK